MLGTFKLKSYWIHHNGTLLRMVVLFYLITNINLAPVSYRVSTSPPHCARKCHRKASWTSYSSPCPPFPYYNSVGVHLHYLSGRDLYNLHSLANQCASFRIWHQLWPSNDLSHFLGSRNLNSYCLKSLTKPLTLIFSALLLRNNIIHSVIHNFPNHL